jgi:phage/plasmid primase-like uncharacterized protein
MNRLVLIVAALAFASPAVAQQTADGTTVIVSGGDYTFDLDDTSGSGETFGDYEEAAPGEASGPDVSFDL